MSSQLLDKLMKEEYERTFQLEDDENCLDCFKEEYGFNNIVYLEDDKTHLSELIGRGDKIINEIQEDMHHSIIETSCKEEPDIDYEDKSITLLNIKDESDLHTNSAETSHLLMHFKQEDECSYDVCNEPTFNENEFCTNSTSLKRSLFELIKEEDDEDNDKDDDMLHSLNDITSDENNIFNIPSEEYQPDLPELFEKRDEMKSEVHDQLTEPPTDIHRITALEDYRLPFFDEDFATSFLINKNLLANNKNYKCHKCGSGVKYYTRMDRGKRRKVMRCKKKGCQTTQSIRKNNSFWACIDKNGRNISKLSISAQLEIVYYWCQNFSSYAIISITGKSNHTVYNWVNMCQEVPLRMFKKRTRFGGPGIVIHINCRSLTHLKKNKGGLFNNTPKSSRWVLVLCNNSEERYFLLENNDPTTLHKIINQEVAVGSIIHSGRWMESDKLLKYGYYHHIVNLDEDFNNSVANAHIRRIESVWKPLVLFYKCRRAITLAIFSSFLVETWWRGLNKSDPFNAFLRDMAEVF